MIQVKQEPVDDEFSCQTLTTEASSPANQNVIEEPSSPSISLAETVIALQGNSLFSIEPEAEETLSRSSTFEGKHHLYAAQVSMAIPINNV